MLSNVWLFLRDDHNRVVLGWLAAGGAALIGAIWGAVKFTFQKAAAPIIPDARLPNVSASNGGVAAGRDISDTKINSTTSSRTDSQ
ncbi:MAG TPA: hypothetical protein VGT78_06315 [Rhizomicrobium sp.]|nr:hypothetical protein [Rhizomicrobium sp.]